MFGGPILTKRRISAEHQVHVADLPEEDQDHVADLSDLSEEDQYHVDDLSDLSEEDQDHVDDLSEEDQDHADNLVLGPLSKPIFRVTRFGIAFCLGAMMVAAVSNYAHNYAINVAKPIPIVEKYTRHVPQEMLKGPGSYAYPWFLFRYSSPPDLALGFPTRLAPYFGMPAPRVASRYRQLNRCWHPDKHSLHCGDGQGEHGGCAYDLKEQKEIFRVFKEASGRAAAENTTWDPVVAMFYDDFMGETREEQVGINSTLPHFSPTCQISLSTALSHTLHLMLTPHANYTPPQTRADLATHCPFTLSHVFWAWKHYYTSLPPAGHPIWYDLSISWSRWSWNVLPLLKFWHVGFRPRMRYHMCSIDEKKVLRWLKEGWVDYADLESCFTIPGSALRKTLTDWQVIKEREWREHSFAACLGNLKLPMNRKQAICRALNGKEFGDEQDNEDEIASGYRYKWNEEWKEEWKKKDG